MQAGQMWTEGWPSGSGRWPGAADREGRRLEAAEPNELPPRADRDKRFAAPEWRAGSSTPPDLSFGLDRLSARSTRSREWTIPPARRCVS
jgi:hypothetical protein